MALSAGMWILIGGGLITFLGVMMLLNHGRISTIIIGVILLVAGLSGAKIGYDMDQETETEYTVTNVTATTAKDSDNNYRVALKDTNGMETWIYVKQDNIDRFPQDATVKITKAELKKYSEMGVT